MACGQKNQNNTQQGGVHLTERTCSPYNPIIKQMVDDCLGMPIYLVSSIDAIIDEEGRTLRQLLEDIQTGASNGTIDLQNAITEIQDFITHIDTYYTSEVERLADKETLQSNISQVAADLAEAVRELNTLKSRLLVVYNLSYTNDPKQTYSDETVNGVQFPKIVDAVNKLRSDVDQLTSGNGPSTQSLLDLQELLLAIVNFNTNKTFTDTKWQELGVDQDPDSNNSQDVQGMPRIIYQILDLYNEVNNIVQRVDRIDYTIGDQTNPRADSILGKLNKLIQDVNSLLQGNFAHLESDIDKLKGSEYPVTSAYFGFDVDSINKSIEAIKRSSKPEYIYIAANSIVGYDTGSSPYDVNGDGKVDLLDVQLTAKAATQSNPPSYYNVDGIEGVDIRDVNCIITAILNGNLGGTPIYSNQEWSNYIYEVTKKPQGHTATPEVHYSGTFETFFGDVGEFIFKKHPVIEGKVYVDINTSQPYRCNISSSGNITMQKVMDLSKFSDQIQEAVGIPPIQNLNVSEPEFNINLPQLEGNDDEIKNYYEIGINDTNVPINIIAYEYPTEPNSSREEGKYYIKTKPSNVLKTCTFDNDMLDHITVDFNSDTYTVTYNIQNVSNLIDVLLSNPGKSVSAVAAINETLYNKKEQLIEWQNMYTGIDSDKEQMCSDIIDLLNDVLNNTSNDRSQYVIKQWAESVSELNNPLLTIDDRVVYVIESAQVTTKSLQAYSQIFDPDEITSQVFDIDGDDSLTVNDIVTLIDYLINGLESQTYSLDTTPVSVLIKYDNGQEKQIISKEIYTEIENNSGNVDGYLGIKTENRLIRLVNGQPNEEWWRFKAGSVCPLIPKVTINYDKISNAITLYTGSVVTGVASMRDEEPTSGPLDGLVIEKIISLSKVYPEPTEPYVFGTWDSSVVQKHPYQEDNYSIKSGTSFVLTKDEVENGTIPELGEDEYSYISDTTEFSMMSTPELTPLVIQCNNLISDFIKEMSATPVLNVLQKYNFEPDKNNRKYYKIIRTKYDAFDFQHITAYVTGNTNEYDHAEIYTIWKDIKIVFDLAGYTDLNSTHNLIDYFDYEAVLHFTTKRNVIADKQYNFPKYGTSLVFNKIDRSGLTWLRPTIITSNTIRFGYSTSEKILDLTPNNFFNIDIVGTTTIDLRPFFSLPGHEALTIQGTIYSSVDNPIINFLGTDTNGNTVTMDPNNPSIVQNKTYRFTIDNAVFTLR